MKEFWLIFSFKFDSDEYFNHFETDFTPNKKHLGLLSSTWWYSPWNLISISIAVSQHTHTHLNRSNGVWIQLSSVKNVWKVLIENTHRTFESMSAFLVLYYIQLYTYVYAVVYCIAHNQTGWINKFSFDFVGKSFSTVNRDRV